MMPQILATHLRGHLVAKRSLSITGESLDQTSTSQIRSLTFGKWQNAKYFKAGIEVINSTIRFVSQSRSAAKTAGDRQQTDEFLTWWVCEWYDHKLMSNVM
jgi:hypothetical protein